jgi:tRNA (guanine-N7-)-methyltransferase
VGFYIRIPNQKQVTNVFLDEFYMQRKIKSFVLRAGRVSPRQEHGLQQLLNHYVLNLTPWQFNTLFEREAKTIVEIGFGMGRSLLEMAQAHPSTNYIGIEVHQAGIGALAADLHASAVTNVKIAPFDAVAVFEQCIPDHSLSGIQIFFPDPWPKKRHHKRRLIQPEFVELLIKKLCPAGFLHIATDWEDYAQHCLTVLADYKQLINHAGADLYVTRPDSRPLTKFEQRGIKLGHGVYDLMFTLKG